MSCLAPSEPERIITGVITDTNDRPIEGAVVLMGDRHTVTDDLGAFRLSGLPSEGSAPITAVADGHTAWTLDTDTLTRFTARLRSREVSASIGVPLTAILDLPTPATASRTIFLSTDTGRILPIRIFEGNQRLSVTLDVPPGARTITALGPAPSHLEPAVWTAPVTIDVAGGDASVILALEEVPVVTLKVRLSGDSPVPGGAALDTTLACKLAGRDAVLLAGRNLIQGIGGVADIEVFPLPGTTACELIASYEIYSPVGAVRHVAFISGLSLPEKDQEIGVKAPITTQLLPDTGAAQGELSWQPAPGAALYDVFIAPDEITRAGDPIWTATTERTSIALPTLPAAATALLSEHADRPHLMRVVARFAPGLDIEDNWDWSGYYAFIASPWLTIPDETLAPFGLSEP